MNQKFIYGASIIACLLLYLFEQVLEVDYFTKTAMKLFLFIVIPIFYIVKIKKQKVKEALNLTRLDKNQLKYGLILGLGSFAVIFIAFFLFQNQIDLDNIKDELINKSNITKERFIFVAFYITFINAFLEEFFFRGFIFLNLKEHNKKMAYLFSSGLFAIYHIAIFKTWFNFGLILLAIVGLVAIGYIFNYIDTKSKNFINSYIVHILADMAIMIIGFSMFGLI